MTDEPKSLPQIMGNLTGSLLDTIVTVFIEHLALISFLEEAGILDKEAFAAFRDSYQNAHYTEISEVMLTAIREGLHDFISEKPT